MLRRNESRSRSSSATTQGARALSPSPPCSRVDARGRTETRLQGACLTCQPRIASAADRHHIHVADLARTGLGTGATEAIREAIARGAPAFSAAVTTHDPVLASARSIASGSVLAAQTKRPVIGSVRYWRLRFRTFTRTVMGSLRDQGVCSYGGDGDGPMIRPRTPPFVHLSFPSRGGREGYPVRGRIHAPG